MISAAIRQEVGKRTLDDLVTDVEDRHLLIEHTVAIEDSSEVSANHVLHHEAEVALVREGVYRFHDEVTAHGVQDVLLVLQ